MTTFTKIIGSVLAVLILATLLLFPIKWIWNDVMPAVFGLNKITLLQAFELDILCFMLFKNIPK